MIALAAPTYDPTGHIVLRPLPGSNFGDVQRRANRVKTLDGGVVVNDSGYASGDRTMRVLFRATSREEYEQVERLVKIYTRVLVSWRDGVHYAVPFMVRQTNARESELQLLIIEEA